MDEDENNYEEDVDDGFASDIDLKRLSELANRQLLLQLEILTLLAKAEGKAKELKKISQDLLPDLMNEVGLSDFKLTDGSQVELVDKLIASIKKDDEPKAFTWLRDEGEEDLIKNTIKASLGMEEDDKVEEIVKFMEEQEIDCEIKASIHNGTLRKFVKGKLEEGEKLPEYFGIHEYKEAKITKPKKSKKK